MKNGLSLKAVGVLCATLFVAAVGPPETPVADAAMRGDTETVRALLREGADVNAAQGDGMTALHWAAERGDVELAGVLTFAGANMEAVTRLGEYTPLHLASKAGYAAVVEALLEAGSDPMAVTSTGAVTPLHFAAASGSSQSIGHLLEHGADVNARETSWGQTPLMFAAANDRVDAVEVLLEAGADTEIASKVVDLGQRSSADRAAGQRRDQVLDAFRAELGPEAEGWRPNPSQAQAAIQAARLTPQAGRNFTSQRDRALEAFRAELGPDADSTQIARVPPAARPGGRGAPPADAAGGGVSGVESPVQQPQQRGGEGFPALVGAQGGLTALHHAAREGHAKTAMVLLDAGADIDRTSGGDHTTPMLIAIINGHFDLALSLLKRGADPDIVSDAGTTPLYAAINTHWAPKARYPQQQAYRQQEATYLDVLRALLEVGANPDLRLSKHLWFMEYTFSHLGLDTNGATPFWRAAHALDVEAMKLLVAHDADPSVATIKAASRRSRGPDLSGLLPVPDGGPGTYPIHAASGHGYGTGYAGNSHRHVPDAWLTSVKYLVEEHGADVNQRDADGYTPLHNAASRGDVEMIRYLVENGADVMVVSRRGQTTADMANGPQQRIQPFPEAIELLVSLGAVNNHNCRSCQ